MRPLWRQLREGARTELRDMPDVLRLSVSVPFLMMSLLLQCPLPSNPCLNSCVPSGPLNAVSSTKPRKCPRPAETSFHSTYTLESLGLCLHSLTAQMPQVKVWGLGRV